jgi:hypothetical protein
MHSVEMCILTILGGGAGAPRKPAPPLNKTAAVLRGSVLYCSDAVVRRESSRSTRTSEEEGKEYKVLQLSRMYT